jgi:methionyl-tRNA synthetase
VLDTTLYHSADALRVIAALIDPVMPNAAERIRRMLGVKKEQWTGLSGGARFDGTRLGEAEALFPRIEKTVEELRQNIMTNESTTTPTPSAETPPSPQAAAAAPADDGRITFDDFMKVDLRVARVLAAEAVPKSKKLIKLRIDVGTEERTIVAGIAEAYSPEQLVGRTIVVVANLKPAKLMGIESNGMVLAATQEGLPSLLMADAAIPPGTRVR